MNEPPTPDERFYEDADAVEMYLAHRHAAVRSPNLVMEDPAVAAEVGDVSGLRILDLGCGDGTFAAACSGAGCSSFVGVDSSEQMILRARQAGTGPEVTFIQETIEAYAPPSAAFDLVISRMALHYIADLAQVFAQVREALVPGGRFVTSVLHPVVTAGDEPPEGPRQNQVVDNYFMPGPRRRMWFGRPVVWHHRTIEQYLSLLADAGLSLGGLRECEPVRERFAGNRAEFDRRRQVPVFLVLSAVRAR